MVLLPALLVRSLRRPGPGWALVAATALVALLVAAAVWARRPGGREAFTEAEETIFVSIASYRDSDCNATLHNLFANAANPGRIVAGVCEQNTRAGAEVCLRAEFPWHDQVRRISLPHKEAKGPTYARYLCSTLYRGEAYFCQIDSHTRFAKGWDRDAIAMLKACPSERPVMTHYPHDWSAESNGQAASGVPVLCKSAFDANGVPTFTAVTLPATGQPKPVPFTSGGFVFGPGSLLRDVAYDPDLPHLFQGEEILYSARAWTSGYDFFTPTKNLVFHHYYREAAPKFWSDTDYAAEQQRTLGKVKQLLTGTLKGYAYGMGKARTLDEYWAYAGVDWASRTTATEQLFCR